MFAQCENAKSHGKKHSAVLNTTKIKRKKRPNLNCFQFHMDTTQTGIHFEWYWVMCTHTHGHRAIAGRMCHMATLLPMAQARNISTSPGTGNHTAPHGLISQERGRLTQTRPCATMTYTLGDSQQHVWRSGVCSLGCITGRPPAKMGALLVHGSNASSWKLRCSRVALGHFPSLWRIRSKSR